MDYFDISKVQLIIPELWKKDWDQAIKECDENLTIVLKSQIRLVNLLKDIDDKSFSFRRAAWLCLWTRLFNIVEGISGALQSNSQVLIEILDRMLFESWLQIYTILGTEKNVNRGERLNAYSAWCLYNDLAFQDYLLQDSIMDGIWDIEEEKSLLEDTPENQLIREKLFGPQDTEKLTTDFHEANKRKMRHKSQEYKKRDRIEKWLEHEEIAPWIQRIKALKKFNPQFYQVIDKTKKNLFSALKSFNFNEKDIEFAYIIYKQSSMTIHGSSFSKNFTLNSKMIFPNFSGNSESLKKEAAGLGSKIYILGVALAILKKDAWPN
jgi:hypothetical protein